MRKSQLLTEADLRRLTTPRILAYKSKLMRVCSGPSWDEEDAPRLHKASPEWKKAYADVKAVLALREHVK